MLVYAVAEWQFSLLCVIINNKNNKAQTNSSKWQQCKRTQLASLLGNAACAMRHAPCAVCRVPCAVQQFCCLTRSHFLFNCCCGALTATAVKCFPPGGQTRIPHIHLHPHTRVTVPLAHLLAFLIWLSAALKSLAALPLSAELGCWLINEISRV